MTMLCRFKVLTCLFLCLISVCMAECVCPMVYLWYLSCYVSCICVCVHVCMCVRARVYLCTHLSVSAPHGPLFRSSYKDCNTLHLPMERFSPVRRFSDGAATIQAFKAHLENSSLIKQLKQVHHLTCTFLEPLTCLHPYICAGVKNIWLTFTF